MHRTAASCTYTACTVLSHVCVYTLNAQCSYNTPIHNACMRSSTTTPSYKIMEKKVKCVFRYRTSPKPGTVALLYDYFSEMKFVKTYMLKHDMHSAVTTLSYTVQPNHAYTQYTQCSRITLLQYMHGAAIIR